MAGHEAKSTVCVTGASGYVASWLVKLLLLRGYNVNATVRSLNDPTKTEHLLALDGAKERLRLFEADLMQEGSFDMAIHGCDGVFHAASPVKIYSPNPQADIVDPAVKGTLNVLASCAKAPTVKRVILTSSTAAVQHNGRPITGETEIDETWFSTPEGCKASRGYWYLLSKTLAEEAAWKFAKENGVDLVVMLPAMVIGPQLQPTLSFSPSFIFSLINGSETYPNESFGWVHVKDVAEAHIRAFENPSAKGRYLLIESAKHVSEIVKILHELYPTLKVAEKCENDQPFEPPYKVSKQARSLGIDYIPLKVGLQETVESLKDMKLISV